MDNTSKIRNAFLDLSNRIKEKAAVNPSIKANAFTDEIKKIKTLTNRNATTNTNRVEDKNLPKMFVDIFSKLNDRRAALKDVAKTE